VHFSILAEPQHLAVTFSKSDISQRKKEVRSLSGHHRAPHAREVSIQIPGKGRPVKEPRRKLCTPTAAEISAYMRSLVERRWKRYADRVARGEVSGDNYVYRPRGPMPPRSKAKQNLTRWENQIANARLVRLALEGRKLSARKIQRMAETTLSGKRPRLHLRFGGQPPKQWHSMHYGRKAAKTSAPNSGSA
jgi:hypothetical protein